MGQRTVVAVAVGALAVALAVAAWRGGARPPPAVQAALHELARRATGSPGGCEFNAGDQAAFEIETSAQSHATPASPSDSFKGVLSWQVVEGAPAEQWLLRAAWSAVDLRQDLSRPDRRTTQPLEATFMLRIGRDCRFLKMGFAPGWLPASRRLVASVLGGFEFAVPPGAPAEGWDAEQGDGMGRYKARYARVERSGDPIELTKVKARYLDEQSAKFLGLQVQLVQSMGRATPDAAGRWLRRASGSERIRLKSRDALLADIEQRYTLNRKDERFAAPDGRIQATQLDWQDPFTMQQSDPTAVDPTIAALSRSDAMQRFGELYRKTPKGDAYASALFLAQWLKAHPEEAGRLLAQLRAGQVVEAMRPAVFLALEQCGTPEARAALAQALADRSLADMDRARAASALSDVPQPTRESAQALIDAARNPDSTLVAAASIRALGHLQERSRTLDPALQSALRGVLQTELGAAQTGSRAIDVVDAIGNTGDAAFTGELSQRLVDPSPSMREHAARAFRRMEAPAAAPPLVARLQDEPEAGVRVALADSLLAAGVREPAALARGAEQLAVEASPAVRAALIRWLGAADGVPAARSALVEQFRREQDPRLLQLIGRYLPADQLK